MREGIYLAIAIAIVAVVGVMVAVMVASIAPTYALGHKIETISGHDYLIVWNSDRGCCAIHAESCPCKSGKDSGGVR